jgi:hypothetical protein
MPGDTRPKRTRTERTEVLAETARLDRLGYTQRQIAARLGTTAGMVNYDLKKIRRQYLESANVSTAEKIGEMLASYRDRRQELYEAWLKSMTDLVKTIEELNSKGEVRRLLRVIKERLPNPRYQELLLKTYQAERDLLGLDAPPKVVVKCSVCGAVSLGIVGEEPPPHRMPGVDAQIANLEQAIAAARARLGLDGHTNGDNGQGTQEIH